MSRERELLQTALGILEDYEWGYGGDHHKSPEASILNDIRKLLAQPEQDLREDLREEPVAWKVIDETSGEFMFSRVNPMERTYKYDVVIPLYKAPPKREPLSEDEIVALWANKSPANEFECVRLVEKAHGIGDGE